MNLPDVYTFEQLASNTTTTVTDLMTMIRENPCIIAEKMGHSCVFDYFYDKMLEQIDLWKQAFYEIVAMLCHSYLLIEIKKDKKYILKLQCDSRDLTDIFAFLLKQGFEYGEGAFLTYSLIARGELQKLQILSNYTNITAYLGIYATAVRFGRIDIMRFFLEIQKYPPAFYGDVLRFEHFVDNFRYLRYTKDISRGATNVQYFPTNHQHVLCIETMLTHCNLTITVNTLERWCNALRELRSDFVLDEHGIIQYLLSKITEDVPMTHDFGEFNIYIFGKEWSTRSHIVDYCLRLEQRLEVLQNRYDKLLLLENRHNR